MNRSPAFSLLISMLAALFLAGCSDGQDYTPTPAQTLQNQFIGGEYYFDQPGLQRLLDMEDQSSPVVMLHLMAVDDEAGFAAYETAIEPVWRQFGGDTVFASRVVEQMLGERAFMEVRAVGFPNAPMLLDALHSQGFASASEQLFSSTSDHAWVVGVPTELPFELDGGYLDPRLLGLDRQDAVALLAASAAGSFQPGSPEGNDEAIIDMLVSDSPEPFYMINLISFREKAQYADGRETTLSGEEANTLYGNTIFPALLAHNSGPEFLFPVSAVLTRDSEQWQQAVVVRYASRDAFLNIFPLNPASDNALEHKDAGVEETLVYMSERRHRTPPQPVDGVMYNLRYCEVLLLFSESGSARVEVWGSQGLNSCPQDQWDELDTRDVAAQLGATLALRNGPRYFVVDWTSNTGGLGGGEPRLFGEIAMSRLTTLELAPEVVSGESRYAVNRVLRDNVWHFVAGRRIYELINPSGNRFIMQSFSRAVDANLTLDELEHLGERLNLPEGWSFASRVLTETLSLPAIDGYAEVITDDLSNTYQRVP